MLKNKKVIIFDLDGTLIDSIGIWNDVDRELIKRISNIDIKEADLIEQRTKKLKECSKYEDAYLEYCGFLKEKYNAGMSKEEIKKLRYEIADSYLREKVDYKPNAEKVLKYLKEKGFTLAIASATNDSAIENYKKYNKNIIKKATLEDTFSVIYSKGSVTKLKPNPEVHYKVMEKFNVKPEECLVIEDSIIGVEAAKSANIDVATIYDKYSDCDRKEIDQLAQYQFSDFYEMLNYMKNELED